MVSKSTIDDVQIILKLLIDNETVRNSKTSKTTVLIVVNEIISILVSEDSSSADNVKDIFSIEIYSTICVLAEKQLENINESDHEFRSTLINLKLTNSIFYKIIPVLTRLSNDCHHSYFLTTTISQMLTYVDKCNKVCILITNKFIFTVSNNKIVFLFVYLGKSN